MAAWLHAGWPGASLGTVVAKIACKGILSLLGWCFNVVVVLSRLACKTTGVMGLLAGRDDFFGIMHLT